MSAKYVSTMYSKVIIRTRQLQITQEIHEIISGNSYDYPSKSDKRLEKLRELNEEYSRLEEWLEGIR
ncbi:hypothetical protein BC6_00081 [Bacillus phage BC-6]|nr:hypothetical protein BC6_00081 [Bacillus phage BC-6]